MALDTSLDAALRSATPLVCCLIRVELPGRTLRLLDGVGQVMFGGELYEGEDAVFGKISAVETVTEEVGTSAPRVQMTFVPATLDALADITQPGVQGSPVTLWFGAVDRVTGALIGMPELLFLGELDAAEIDAGDNATLITFDIASAWERLFEVSEGQRLNNAFHQSIWPGELGFQYVTAIQREEPWGYAGARPALVADVIGGAPGQGSAIGGGGGGGGFDRGDHV